MLKIKVDTPQSFWSSESFGMSNVNKFYIISDKGKGKVVPVFN
jgi:hypothetical protein